MLEIRRGPSTELLVFIVECNDMGLLQRRTQLSLLVRMVMSADQYEGSSFVGIFTISI